MLLKRNISGRFDPKFKNFFPTGAQLGAALILARSGSGAALSDFMPERERSAAPILQVGVGAERNSSFCRSANTLHILGWIVQFYKVTVFSIYDIFF